VGPKPAGRAFVGDRTGFRLTTFNFSANNKRSALRGKWKGNVTSPDLRGLVERDRTFDNFASARYTVVGLASTLPEGKKSDLLGPPEPGALMVPFRAEQTGDGKGNPVLGVGLGPSRLARYLDGCNPRTRHGREPDTTYPAITAAPLPGDLEFRVYRSQPPWPAGLGRSTTGLKVPRSDEGLRGQRG
jgi:hypothetical protein